MADYCQKNIESQEDNWLNVGGGSGCLKQGNNGNHDDGCGYGEGKPEAGKSSKASHVLSNGELIYHFSGNVREWVQDDMNETWTTGSDSYAYDSDWELFAPARKSYSCNKANHFCGLGYSSLSAKAGAIVRGGSWSDGDHAGVFATFLYTGPSNSSPEKGFRCVLRKILGPL